MIELSEIMFDKKLSSSQPLTSSSLTASWPRSSCVELCFCFQGFWLSHW